jgi:hypothetical protein
MRFHEQILPSLNHLHYQRRWSDMVIFHTGYQDPELRRRKLERDLRLLRLEDRDRPDPRLGNWPRLLDRCNGAMQGGWGGAKMQREMKSSSR